VSTNNPADPTSLRIVDQETGVELAELGMEVRRRARACRECRFCSILYDSSPRYDSCLAFAGADCHAKNPNADCEFWEAPAVVVARVNIGERMISAVLGTIFGGAIVGLLVLLFGG